MKNGTCLAVKLLTICWLLGSSLESPLQAEGLNDGLIFDFDFNAVQDGRTTDSSPSRCKAKIVDAETCQGVDGYGIRLPGTCGCVNVDLADADRKLDAFSVDVWLSPEEAAHQEVITACSTSGGFDTHPIMLRWRKDWQMWLSVQTVDDERRILTFEKPCIEMISFPRNRAWTHVVATYDGENSALYINGQLFGTKKWSSKKSVKPIDLPVKVGGHGGLYRGGVDNFRLYRRALQPADVKQRYEQHVGFKPETPAHKFAGTIDGNPYFGCGRGGSWSMIPLKRGALRVSNTGEIEIWGASDVNPSNQFDYIPPISVLGQLGHNERYYREVAGDIQMHSDGSAQLAVEGKTVTGLRVKQLVNVTKNDEVNVRYEFAAEKPQIPAPALMFHQHLWSAALRFVGHDDNGLITGNLMDLDGDLWCRGLTEFNLISSDNRLVVNLDPESRLHIKGSRDPRNWLNGYTTFPGEIRSSGGDQQWVNTRKSVIAFTLQLESDDLPCRLQRRQAREVTSNVPFDFSRLYEPDRSKLTLVPVQRDTPIFSDDEAIVFEFGVPDALQATYQKCSWVLSDAGAETAIRSGKPVALVAGKGLIELAPGLKPGVYVLRAEGLAGDDKSLGRCETEVVVTGEIAQAKGRVGNLPKLKKVDEADLTRDDPKHDFFSFSGKSQVVNEKNGNYRRTLTYQECQADLSRQGLDPFFANDWFGVRFKTQPGKVYVVEVEYPDLPYMSVSAYLIEPKDGAPDGQCRPIERTTSGLFTGNFLPHDGHMKTMQIVHFASAPWMAACWQNGHCGRPSSDKVLDPACASRITLYEVEGDLPALDAPATADRQLGVFCESGGLALASFGPEKFRGENGNWNDRPDHAAYYRHAYAAVANLIRYMRYRGDTTLFYGIYRYRPAMFPSRTFPSASAEYDIDLPGLVARMFEKNGLKVVFNVMAHNALPTARLQEATRYDIVQGMNSVCNVNQDGRRDPPGRNNFPSVSPFHPAVREAYSRLAAELAERYGKLPAVSGISWMTGQSWWEPCLTIPSISDQLSAEEADRMILGIACDDETIRQFETWAGVKLPGQPPEADRFKKRHEWIIKHGKEKFLDFRCWAMVQTHLAFQKAFAAKAPGKDYLALDFYYDVFAKARQWPSPLEAIRRIGFGPTYFKGVPGLVYFAYMPEFNGCTYWEHSIASWDVVKRIQQFTTDEQLAKALGNDGKTTRFLHRQFYEQSIRLPKDAKRRWMWAPDVECMGVCSYPQQGGRGYLADFAYMLARGTPNYISYSWCDSTIPLGHEPMHREIAAVYRNLPKGQYREADRKDGVFARVLEDGPPAFYIVNTMGAPVELELRTGCSGTFTDPVARQTTTISNGKQSFRLQPYECKVFLHK